MSAPEIRQASPAQRAAADPGACVWVGANAGTGKTRVLIDRVTRLLLAGADPAHILCLTYTKAAAAEMESRLFEQLGRWATQNDSGLRNHLLELQQTELDSEALRHARRLFARALETPGGLKIRTIHAFCEGLLRRFPIEAGVPPHFEVLDDLLTGELYARAREQVLASALGNADAALTSAVMYVVDLVSEGAFDRLARDAMGASDHPLDMMLSRLHHKLGVKGGVAADEFLKHACSEAALPVAGLRRAAALLAQGSDAEKQRAHILTAFLVAENRHFQFDMYQGIFLTQKGQPTVEKYLITKSSQKKDQGVLEILLREQDRIFQLAQKLRAIEMARASGAALRLGEALRLQYARAKAQRGVLDYEDLITYSLAMLKSQGAAWVHFKLDAGIDHILVDEAQDTSPPQWEIIRLLSDEFFTGHGARGKRSIFAVGDEKQSIYSFQGASPESFARMREYFAGHVTAANMTWRNVALIESFRSTRQVLRAVDDVFAAGPARAGLTADDGAITHAVTRSGPGRVEIWPPVSPEAHDPPGPWDAPLDAGFASNPRALLAQRIAGRIKRWLDTDAYLPASGKTLRPGDIIILVQRRDAFVEEMIRKLKALNIPVAGADKMVLSAQIAVMDLIALGKFVLMPDDDLTLAELLRSPLAGFSEENLFALAYGRKQARLWDELRGRRDENQCFADAYRLLSHFLGRADQTRPYEFYAEALAPLRGRQKLLARLGPDANDPIDEFLALSLRYERQQTPSLQGFLHWLTRSETIIKRDMEHGGDAVRVMTVHGAKGLEAPIVFLPDTCWMPGGQHDPALLPVAGEPFRLWPVRRERDDPLAANAREMVQAAREAEYHRQLYVAMTRARDWLIICGYEGKNARAKGCWYNLVETSLLPDAREIALEDGSQGWLIEGDAPAAGVQAPSPAASAARQINPDWLHQDAPPEPYPSAPLTPSRTGAAPPLAGSPRDAQTAAGFRRGALIHRLLQVLPELPPQRRTEAARNYLMRPAHDLTPDMIDAIIAETLGVLHTPEFAAVFAPGSRAEVPLAGVVPALGGMAISGQIDRLCVTATEILIVDYKTGGPAPQNAAQTPAAYLRQMATYRAALQSIYPGRAVRCALLWTGKPVLTPLPDALLDAALSELVLDAGAAPS